MGSVARSTSSRAAGDWVAVRSRRYSALLMNRYPFSIELGSGTAVRIATSESRKKSRLLKEVPAPMSMSTTSTSSPRSFFRIRTFCMCLMFAAVSRSPAPLRSRSAGDPVSVSASSMVSTRRWMKSVSVRSGVGRPRHV